MASKSIRDRLLTGSRIPLSKRATAIFFFAENLPATEVAKIVGISLRFSPWHRDREQNLIMGTRKTMAADQYFRLWEQDTTAYFNREAEKDYKQFWREMDARNRRILRSLSNCLPPLPIPKLAFPKVVARFLPVNGSKWSTLRVKADNVGDPSASEERRRKRRVK